MVQVCTVLLKVFKFSLLVEECNNTTFAQPESGFIRLEEGLFNLSITLHAITSFALMGWSKCKRLPISKRLPP